MMDAVRCTDVGYCSSSIFGFGKERFGREERHDSRCLSFMPTVLDERDVREGEHELWTSSEATVRDDA